MSFISRLALVALTAVSATHVAHAATVTQTEAFAIAANSPPTGGFEAKGGGTFDQFNAALGTLTGIGVSFSGTGTLSASGGGGTLEVVNDVVVTPPASAYGFDGLGQAFFLAGGSEAISLSTAGTLSSTSANHAVAFAAFTGSGTVLVQPGFEGTAPDISDLVFSFPSISETLTYTYTPSAAIPEPASVALVGVALVGLGCSRRKKANLLMS